MKLLILRLITFLIVSSCGSISVKAYADSPVDIKVPVLTYHDVVAGTASVESFDTVSLDTLIRHFKWLSAEGYTPISMEHLEAAVEGRRALPARPILLTFDDGFVSFYEQVYPLLKSYNWPALQAVITSQIDDTEQGNSKYLSPKQIKEMYESGLVSFASHTHNLHKGVPANAWGNLQPSAVTRIWNHGEVESDILWRERVTADLLLSAHTLKNILGHSPRYLVWPYGRYNNHLSSIGTNLGYHFQFTLDPGVSDVRKEKLQVKRYLVGRNDSEGTLRRFLESNQISPTKLIPVKAAVSILAETEKSPKEERLSLLIENLRKSKGNTVILNPFKLESGKVIATTYPSSVLPLTSTYANRVAAAVYNKTGSAILLGVYLSPSKYLGLKEDAILQVIEEAAKAIPISGIVVEDAQDVPYESITKALARVALWRQAPRLEVKVDIN